MKDLIWDSSLSVQIQEVDDDHRKLVDLFNMLNHSVMEGDPTNYIETVLEELICCTIWHFSHEERLMTKYNYDGFEAHRAEHQELIESVRTLQQKLLREGKSPSSEDIRFLEHWLVGHILSVDMDMGSYLGEVM